MVQVSVCVCVAEWFMGLCDRGSRGGVELRDVVQVRLVC